MLIAAAAVVVVIMIGAGIFLATRLGNHAPSSAPSSQGATAGPSTAPSASLPGAATMTALGSYLAQSASVRPTIQSAIDQVQSCSESPATGQAALQQAVNVRQHILSGLQALSPAGLPHGTQLIGSLTTAMQHSITADQDYQAWMTDFANAGRPCESDPNKDANFTAGQNASLQATTAKNSFLSLWNPMAPRYGQRAYTSTEFLWNGSHGQQRL